MSPARRREEAKAEIAANAIARTLASGMTTTATRAEVKALLLATGGTLFCRGQLTHIVAKHLGAGVYSLSLKESV